MKKELLTEFKNKVSRDDVVVLTAFGLLFFAGFQIPQAGAQIGAVIEEGDRFVGDLNKVAGIAAARHLPESEPKSERVIVIDIDTLAASHVGAYGYERNTTPFLDSFAQNNTVFKNTVAPATWTRASQMSVFTGTYPRTHGFLLVRHKAPDEFNTIPEEFQKAGYRTGAFTGGKGMKDGLGFEQGFDNYTDHDGTGYVNFEDNFGRAFSFIESNSEDRTFTFIHGYDVHDPYGDTPGSENYPIAENYRTPVSKDRLFYENGTGYITGTEGVQELDQQDIKEIRKAYDQDVRHVDRKLKEFVERLKQKGLYEDSTIVIYSSHGENLADNIYERPRRKDEAFGHLYLWPQTTQVPMIIKSPEMEPGIVEEPVSIIDIAPTLYDLAGISPDPKTSRQQAGNSLLREGRVDPEFSETKQKDSISVNREQYKLLDREEKEDVLYVYNGSSFKQVERSARRETYQDLQGEVQRWRERTPDNYSQAVKLNYESRTMTVLRSLLDLNIFEKEDRPLRLERISIESSDSFRITDQEEIDSEEGKVRTVKASSDDRTLEIKIFPNRSSKTVAEYIRERREEAISVYKGAEPYGFRPGADGCSEDFSPEIDRYVQNNITSIRFYENDEGFKGACEGRAHRQVTVYMGYCSRTSTLFVLEDRKANFESSSRLRIGCVS